MYIESKPARQSKTIWLNALTALATLAAILADIADLQSAFPELIPEDGTKYVLLFVAVANIILRRVTTQPIQSGGAP